VSTSKTSQHRRHDAVTGEAWTAAVERLAPTVVTLSEQPHTNRADRRHVRTRNGGTVNVAKAARRPGLNEPYRKPVAP
jgi:hypothetical protein